MIQNTNRPGGNLRSENLRLPTQLPQIPPKRIHAFPKSTLPTVKNLSNVLIYLWLNNGNSFWFYISYATDNRLVGYSWTGSQWVSRTYNLQTVWSYY